MNSLEYTEKCLGLAKEITDKIDELSDLMKDNGDDVRAMDLNEAKMYVNASVEE